MTERFPGPQSQDDWDSHWSTYSGAATVNPAQKMRHQLMLELVKAQGAPVQRLLDVGSGQGDFLAEAAREGVAEFYAGFELSESGVRITRGKLPQADIQQVNLFQPGPEAARFQNWATVAVCSEVVEHVDDPVAFLAALRSYLAEDAPLVLTVPGGPRSAFDIHIGHRRHFTKQSVRECLTKAGFQIDKVWLAGFPFFNLYRLAVVLRGKKLIVDVASGEAIGAGRGSARLLMEVFRALFALNLKNSPFGWQVIAVARKAKT